MKNKLYIVLSSVFLVLGACKDREALGPDPYSGGKEALGIRFADALPYPSQGREGTAMTFKVSGIKEEYKSKMQFVINGLEASITSVTDSTLTAVLPADVSTGGTRLVIDGQIYPGPVCRILGNVDIDPLFNAGIGSNGTISTIKQLGNGQVFIGGLFSDYNGAASRASVNGLARITVNGEFVPLSGAGKGAEQGSINSIHQIGNDELLLSGSIKSYNEIKLINNITTVGLDGGLKMKEVEVLNVTSDPEKSKMKVPVFNGGVSIPAYKTYVFNGTVTALGNFGSYLDYFYQRSTVDQIIQGMTEVGGLVRMDMTGALDQTFNMDKSVVPNKPNRGLEGIIQDGFMQADGKLIVVGRLSRYNNQSVKGNIIRVNIDGSQDVTFNTGAAGANETVFTIAGTTSGKLLVLGAFTTFNGVAADGLVLLNNDGTVDPSFKSLGFEGGKPNYSKQLSNGKILVSGTFTRYGGVIREGLCILNADGTLASGYNNTGKLDGYIFDAIEGTNSKGQKTVTLVGTIKRFNGKSNIGNIMRLAFTEAK